jgi:hypothetical protein
MMKNKPHAFGVDDIAAHLSYTKHAFGVDEEILFSAWVNLSEH